MPRLYDRVMSTSTRFSAYDLFVAQRFYAHPPGDGYMEMMFRDPWQAELGRGIRSDPSAETESKSALEGARVVAIDNVYRYVSEHTLTGPEVRDMLADMAVVPPYDTMFVEARCINELTGARSFGWLVERIDNDGSSGGWTMSFSLFVEWEKNRPLGPLLRFEWKLDDKGRFIKVPDTDDPLEMYTHPLPENPSQHPELLGQPCLHVLEAMPAAHWSLIFAMGLMHLQERH